MKRVLLIVILLPIIMFSYPGCARKGLVSTRPYPPPGQRVTVDFSIFYDDLAPYGHWFQLDGYGWVWTPYEVSVSWRPYSYGFWIWSDFGWTWVSRHRWGWGPFHYGRWLRHRNHGWVWIPGTVWGPAWVVWRHSAGWIGWAPLPPQAGWRPGFGLTISWSDMDRVIEPHWYSFVDERYMTDRNLDRRLELTARNATLIRSTNNVTRYEASGNRVMNRSLNVESIERQTGRKIPRYRVVDSGQPIRSEESRQVRGNEITVYRPKIDSRTPDRTPREVGNPRFVKESEADLKRRQEDQRRRLEIEQAREREVMKAPPREVKPGQKPTVRVSPEQIRRKQEAERQALEKQVQREKELLRQKQEAQRKVESARKRPETPQRKTPERKPKKP